MRADDTHEAGESSDITRVRYSTAEQRAKHAAKQREWRRKNKERATEIAKKSSAKRLADPAKAAADTQRKRNYKLTKHFRTIVRPRQRKKRYVNTQNAKNTGKRWTDREVLLVFDPVRTDKELSVILGRSIKAIELARIRYAIHAPEWWSSKGTPARG